MESVKVWRMYFYGYNLDECNNDVVYFWCDNGRFERKFYCVKLVKGYDD